MSRGRKILVGCLAVPAALLAMALALAAIVCLWPTPEPRIVNRTAAQDHAADRPLEPTAPSSDARASPVEQVDVDLEDGEFRVQAGTGDSLRAEGVYDETAYALEVRELAPGHLAVRFHSTLGVFQHLARMRMIGRTGGASSRRVAVYLPTAIPITLNLRVHMGKSRIDLSAVRLRGLDLDLAMGQHAVVFNQPNPEPLERLKAKTGMGEFQLSGLGYAGARTIEVASSMGHHRIDFAGALTAPSTATLRLRMGEMRVRVPAATPLLAEPAVVMMGSFETRRPGPGALGPTVAQDPERATADTRPRLTLSFDVAMGSVELR